MSGGHSHELETRIAKLTKLVDTSLVLNSTLKLELLLRKIMDSAAEIVEAETASILLVDPQTQGLHFMAFTNESEGSTQSESLKRIPVPLDSSIAGEAVLKAKPIAIDDVTTHPKHYRKADDTSGFVTRSILGIPMELRDRVIGVLEAINKHEGSWTEQDIYFLTILASQAAVAIENSGLVAKLTEAYQELSQVDKLKNDFIAIASHELRTPLGVILGYASFLQEESHGEATEHATAVLNSALHMRQIIEDMTNLRFLKIGDGELTKQSVPVSQVMMTALNDVYSLTEAKGNKLHYTVPTDNVLVDVDQGKIIMALTNILNNAIKYSPERGFIELSYQLQGEREIWVFVRDQGVGIEPEHLDKIFDEFFQAEDHMTRRHNGMGLGLSIARAIIQAHQGRIWAESQGKDQGSTVYLSLPLISG